MSDDQITDLARLLPAEAAPDLPADRLQILKEHLMLEYRRAADTGRPAPQRRRARRPLLAALGAGGVLAAVAATALALVLSGGQPAPASPAAVELLAKVANVAAGQPAPAGEQQRVHVHQERGRLRRVQQRQPDPDHGAAARAPDLAAGGQHLRLGAGDRGGSADLARALARQSPSSSVKCGTGNLDNATYRLLQSLPTDPRTLLNLIYTFDQTNGEGQALGSDGEAFVTIGDLIRETIVPPSTAAALYRAAALIPGVTLIGRVTNVEGQPGIAIAWTSSQDRYEWIFDPATLQYVGERDYDMSTGKPVVTGNAAVLQRAFVGKAGQLP